MIRKRGFIILGSIAVIGILLFALQQIFVKTTLSEQEIINRVESLYNGSVEDIAKNARHYNVVFSDGTKVYEVVVDEEQGTFRDLTLIADRGNSIAVNNEATDNEIASSQEQNVEAPSNSSQATQNEKPTSSHATTSNEGVTLSAEKPAPTPPANPVRITKSAATEIALKQLNGEVEDIEFYSAADGGYYIIEIETAEQEAAFQIHAITGKILSVVYDD